MKKWLLPILLLFVPCIIFSLCNTNDLEAECFLENKTDGVTVNTEPVIVGTNINLDLSMSEVGDNIKYKVVINNNSTEDYEINNDLSSNSEYFTYELSTKDNSNTIKSNSQKELDLTIEYKDEIPDDLFERDVYNATNNVVVRLTSTEEKSIINPQTGINRNILVLLSTAAVFIIIIISINKNTMKPLIVILGIIIIPVSINATCSANINVNSNIEVEKQYDITGHLGYSDDIYESYFLGTNIEKVKVKKVTFTNSIEGKTANDVDCFDVSYEENGSVLAWISEEDENGFYELTIGSTGKVFTSECNGLFYNFYNTTEYDGMKYLDTRESTNMSNMFGYNVFLETIDVTYLNTSNVTDMSGMFYANEKNEKLDVSYFDTSNVTNMNNMFGGWDDFGNGLKEITGLTNWNTSKVTDMSGMFSECHQLEELDLSSFDTTNVTNMSKMFRDDSSLKSLDISSFDTSNVTDMVDMFDWCFGLTELDLSNWNTSKVTNMGGMFFNCNGLESLDISSFDTTNVTNMSSMFTNNYKLKELDLSHFNTSKVTRMTNMFSGCKELESLNISNFDVSNVDDFSSMFYGCENLTTLDLSSFDTSNVTNMNWMFRGDKELTTIYVSDNFVTTNVSNSSYMFTECRKLVGGAGTKVYPDNSNIIYTDKRRARIDNPPDSPGYFTRKTN